MKIANAKMALTRSPLLSIFSMLRPTASVIITSAIMKAGSDLNHKANKSDPIAISGKIRSKKTLITLYQYCFKFHSTF
ncbi:hypothetical protein DH09_20145 [Bacillaceae bacterium JMAK1]|nr:hypothetical protein DH09_20145 [Bacillaceae bacterium JMAK1]